MMIAATDLGIGSAHAAVKDPHLAHKTLDLPADRFCEYLIVLGYPSDRPLTPITHPKRRALADVVRSERW
jgi:hypothetical protein